MTHAPNAERILITKTPEAEHANEEPVCMSQFASAEEFYQTHIESKEPLKGFKRRIIDHVRNNPMESECDLTDVVLGLEEILKEYREAYLKTVSPSSQAESESQTDLWNDLGNKINKHMKPLDDDFGIHPLLDLYGKSEFTITRKTKL